MKTKYNHQESYMMVIIVAAVLIFIILSLPGCLEGERGIVGPTGQTGSVGSSGAPGSTGAQGLQGQPGVDTTPITIVQFCQGAYSYPSVFPEEGFCIAGNLYAVYSANDGFLSILPPGLYESNAIGSACTFIVLPNCEIQD